MGARYVILIFTALALPIVSGCSAASSTPEPPDYWPTDGWITANAVDLGIDPLALDAAFESIPDDLPFLDGALVIRNGYIVHESYYNGFDQEKVHDIRSVTKSWTSALTGMARANGELTQLNAPLSELLPSYFSGGSHEDKRGITLAHLLAMRSGIDFDDEKMLTGEYGGEELLAGDLTEFALEFPLAHGPGSAWNYSTLDSQLVSAIFERAMGESLEGFAADHLFAPLGIEEYFWLEDGTGTSIGGGNLHITLRDMAKLGLLYLHNGRWEGEQLVPADWVELSLTPQNTEAYYEPTDQSEFIEWYGYHWWTWKGDWFFGYRAFQAQGFAGQQILAFPELELIVVTTASAEGVSPEIAGAQEEKIAKFIHDSLLPTLTEINIGE